MSSRSLSSVCHRQVTTRSPDQVTRSPDSWGPSSFSHHVVNHRLQALCFARLILQLAETTTKRWETPGIPTAWESDNSPWRFRIKNPDLLIASISFHHLKQVVKVAEIGIYHYISMFIWLAFPFCTFRSRGVCVRCAVQTKKASAHGVEFLSSFGASLVSIAGGAERDSI